MSNVTTFILQHSWLGHLILLVVTYAIVMMIYAKARAVLLPRAQATDRSWDDTLLQAIHRPFKLGCVFLLFILALQIAAGQWAFLSVWSHLIHTAQSLGLLLAFFWFGMRYVAGVERHLLQVKLGIEQKRDRTSVRAAAQLIRVAIVVIAFLNGLKIFGYTIDALLAYGGIGALAVGFAAKDSLANFFGGMMIFWDKPFSVGDWVRSPDRQIEGVVDQIGWRLTRIITFDKRPLYVPNSLFSTVSVENPSRMSHRRIYETVGLRYDDAPKLKMIVDRIEHMLRQHDDIDSNQTLMVKFNEFGASSLNFFIYTFTKTTDWVTFHRVKQEVLLKVIDIITACGAECAFPTTTVHLPMPMSNTKDIKECLYD